MTTIFERVADALVAVTPAVPFAADEMLTASGDLPDLYLVYQVITGVGEQHADDQETERAFRVQVSMFNRGGLVSMPDVDTAMLAAGFTKGPERSLSYDPRTRHYGYSIDYFLLKGVNT